MNGQKRYTCAICGHSKQPSESFWCLIVGNKWEDTLKVLQWNSRLADQAGVYRTCSVSHLEELVVHWMVTGRVDYPFARLTVSPAGDLQIRQIHPDPSTAPDTTGAHQIGEISVHRESFCRAIAENPQSLKPILEALHNALDQGKPPRKDRSAEREIVCALT